MARRRGLAALFIEPEPDPRPLGTVQFADPSTARMAERFNTFNDPPSGREPSEQRGLQPSFGSQSPWSQKFDGERAFENMRRKRGVKERDGKEG